MIVCKKCHKAMKSKTATEFCKCCYQEPDEVANEITYNGKLTPTQINHLKEKAGVMRAINEIYESAWTTSQNQTNEHDNSSN